MIQVRNIRKSFGSLEVLKGIDLQIAKGETVVILGPSGSGKSTFLRCINLLEMPTSGEILFNGAPVGIESRRHVAYMSTEPYFYAWMSVKDVGKYYQDFFEDFSPAKYEELLRYMELEPGMKTRTLSSGMMAKLKIAVTMARNAQVYMLDEPFNGIDLLARDEIRKCILQEATPDKLLILSSHLVEEMEAVADRAVFIKNGNLVEVRDLEEMRETDNVSMADRYREIYGHTEG